MTMFLLAFFTATKSFRSSSRYWLRKDAFVRNGLERPAEFPQQPQQRSLTLTEELDAVYDNLWAVDFCLLKKSSVNFVIPQGLSADLVRNYENLDSDSLKQYQQNLRKEATRINEERVQRESLRAHFLPFCVKRDSRVADFLIQSILWVFSLVFFLET